MSWRGCSTFQHFHPDNSLLRTSLVVKNSPAGEGDTGLILVWKDSIRCRATKPAHGNY